MIAAVLLAAAATAAPAPTADAIVADYVAARGGIAKIRAIRSLRQKGRAFAGAGREAIVLRELKRPDKSRFEFTTQGVTGVFVAAGGKGWKVSPFDGDLEAKPLSEDAVAEAMEQTDIEGPLVDWKAKGHSLKLAGRETIDGREAYKLELTLASGGLRHEYIDVKTHALIRTDSTRTIRGREVGIQTVFRDHKKTSGVLFPRTVEVVAVGRPQKLRVVVESVEVNPPIADARFEK